MHYSPSFNHWAYKCALLLRSKSRLILRSKVTHCVCFDYSKPGGLSTDIEAVSLGLLEYVINKGALPPSKEFRILD